MEALGQLAPVRRPRGEGTKVQTRLCVTGLAKSERAAAWPNLHRATQQNKNSSGFGVRVCRGGLHVRKRKATHAMTIWVGRLSAVKAACYAAISERPVVPETDHPTKDKGQDGSQLP